MSTMKDVLKRELLYKLKTDMYRTMDYLQTRLNDMLDYKSDLYYMDNNHDNLKKILNDVFDGDMENYSAALIYGRYKPDWDYLRVNSQLEVISANASTLKAIYQVNADNILDLLMSDDDILEEFMRFLGMI